MDRIEPARPRHRRVYVRVGAARRDATPLTKHWPNNIARFMRNKARLYVSMCSKDLLHIMSVFWGPYSRFATNKDVYLSALDEIGAPLSHPREKSIKMARVASVSLALALHPLTPL